jgi:hypothetical protein
MATIVFAEMLIKTIANNIGWWSIRNRVEASVAKHFELSRIGLDVFIANGTMLGSDKIKEIVSDCSYKRSIYQLPLLFYSNLSNENLLFGKYILNIEIAKSTKFSINFGNPTFCGLVLEHPQLMSSPRAIAAITAITNTNIMEAVITEFALTFTPVISSTPQMVSTQGNIIAIMFSEKFGTKS